MPNVCEVRDTDNVIHYVNVEFIHDIVINTVNGKVDCTVMGDTGKAKFKLGAGDELDRLLKAYPWIMRKDIENLFGNCSQQELLEMLSEIADSVDYAEDPDVILSIQEYLGQKRH